MAAGLDMSLGYPHCNDSWTWVCLRTCPLDRRPITACIESKIWKVRSGIKESNQNCHGSLRKCIHKKLPALYLSLCLSKESKSAGLSRSLSLVDFNFSLFQKAPQQWQASDSRQNKKILDFCFSLFYLSLPPSLLG